MKRTYVLNLAFLGLIAVSLLAPSTLVDSTNGLASAATAVVVFLFFFVLAGILASYQFIYTYRRRNTFSKTEVILGVLPFILSLLSCATLFVFLGYQ